MSEEAKKLAKNQAWTCEYCGERSYPANHGCLQVNLKQKISALEKEIGEFKIKCVNKHADSERLIEWIKESEKKPANIAFTEGPDRQLAYYFERLEEEIESMKFDKKNLMMFFKVAAEGIGIDATCQPGMLDPMCTAEAIRGLKQENFKLKEAAEAEFQKAEGKAEMKRWFQERLHGLEEENAALREGLDNCYQLCGMTNHFDNITSVVKRIFAKYPKKEKS